MVMTHEAVGGVIAKDPGPYNVEVDANGRPIALVQFTIK